MLKSIYQYGYLSIFTLVTLFNILLVVIFYSFLREIDIFDSEVLISLIFTPVLYTGKILISYLFLFLFLFLWSERETLEKVSLSSLFKILLVADFINVLGDALHISKLILYPGMQVNNYHYLYSSYPLSISNLFETNILAAGILKDLNLFQLLSIVILCYGLRMELNIKKPLTFKIGTFSSLSSLIIVNLIWALLIIAIPDEFFKL